MDRPIIVTLCGSTRFSQAFHDANLHETLDGKMVFSIGCDMRTDTEIFVGMSETELDKIKAKLDWLHKRKIDACDEILVLNVGGYIGPSTRSEVAYAALHDKRIRWLEPDAIPAEFATAAKTMPAPQFRQWLQEWGNREKKW